MDIANQIQALIGRLDKLTGQLVGDEGAKVDVTANISPITYAYLAATIVGSGLIVMLVYNVFKTK